MEANYFTILLWFLPYIDMNQPWVYMCSSSWTPSHLPPHPIPQGHPRTPALSTLSHASNLDWQSISHMIIYMFQCYSLKSSHPHILPQSPKVCSIHLCLLLSYIQGYRYHLSKFHIYALVYCIGVFLSGLLHKTRRERDTCTPMFITALFIIARTWKQPRCASADG